MSLVVTMMYESTITSDLTVPYKYSPYKTSLELFEAGYKVAMISLETGRDLKYWQQHKHLQIGLEITTSHNHHYWESFLPLNPTSNGSFCIPENYNRIYGEQKISVLVFETEKRARYYAKGINF